MSRGHFLSSRVGEETVKRVICKQGETRPQRTTVTLQRDGMTLLIRKVPAEVCENCGEAYVDEITPREILHRAEEAASAGVMVDVREYAGITENQRSSRA